ncbi:hypothetical protein CDAR_386861 [Caerostris darwini]|uniref:Uncharacterized protein n=1 Tax=Caerostris darwini TaxID=1538125 RepID=A0AAV4PKI3_9ARAC|nr:hypothetical protein CDAR_386861 [Caerostris darwini]
MGTNFFWMFVEGLYLFILVVKTFTVDNVKLYVYTTIGWGESLWAIGLAVGLPKKESSRLKPNKRNRTEQASILCLD